MGAMKEFFLHKLVLRLVYIGGAYSTSHIIALASSPKVTDTFHKAGIMFKITDPKALESYLTALMLVAGEFVFYKFHETVVIPQVNAIPPKA